MVKRTIRHLIPLVYIALVLLSILLILKPGSSIFFYKYSIKRDRIDHDSGYSYRYLINASPLIFSYEGILLYEDGKPLEHTLSTQVVDKGGGNFSLSDPSSGKFYLYFSTTDNSDPRSGNKQFKIFYPVVFLSLASGINYLTVLLLGIAWFLFYVFKSAPLRQSLKPSPANFFGVFDSFIDQEVTRVFSPIISLRPLDYFKRTAWNNLFFLTIVAAYFYVFMEWLFFVTKPSFMDLMGWIEKVEILLVTGFIIAMVSGILLLICFGLDFLITRRRRTALLLYVGTLIPATILSVTCLLLVDNFTYTIFKFGIVSTDSILRWAYGMAFIVSFIYLYTRILAASGLRGEIRPHKQVSRISSLLMGSLMMVSALPVLADVGVGYFNRLESMGIQGSPGRIARRPNILLLGSDGLSAENLSAYGYNRDTTPTLRKLAQDSLLAENAFPNAAHSSGSDISILTGKAPTKSRVLYPPDILKGADAYQHLPGILSKMGYSTVELGVTYYVDAYQMNLLDGFDSVNLSTYNENEVVRFARERGGGDTVYFASRLAERVFSRLSHIFFIKKMINPYTIVIQPISKQSDRERLERLEALIRESDRPLFVHIHMMGTHGPRFTPEQQVFSVGEVQDKDWMTDFYDDGILNFDRYVGEILDTLMTTGKLDNTVIIIYSDHAMISEIRHRTPLIMHFPNREYVGRIQNNVENLDIAPTILDYMGLPQPDWMDGRSLLKSNFSEHRLIFSSGIFYAVSIGGGFRAVDTSRAKPPFYQFGYINMIDCSNWYRLDLIRFTLLSGKIPGHTSPCNEDSMPTLEQAKAEMVKYLADNGFDVSTIP